MTTLRYLLSAAAIVLFAFLLREWYVLASFLPNPTQGDVSAYLRYALHLVWDGTFTQAGNGEPVIPDAFRSPGYPLFLAVVFRFAGMDNWYPAVYQAQAVIGALTVACAIALARQSLPRGWSLLVGALLAVWPHHIVATNAMLTEIVFGFAILLSLLLTTLSLTKRSLPLSILSGAAFGCSYLVNPVAALFPIVLLAVFWREQALKLGGLLLLVSLFAVAGWSWRNTLQHASGDDRATINLVQGSWPEYHRAQKLWPQDPNLLRAKNAIIAETTLIRTDRIAGLHSIGARIAENPARFAGWYLLKKPFLLWDWDVRMGKGGIYTLDVQASPLDTNPVLRAVTTLLKLANPLFFAFAAGFALLALRRGGPASSSALFFLYITVVHVVFQAEPRYAIAYRPIEILLAVSSLAMITATYQKSASAAPTVPVAPSSAPQS